MQPVEKPDPNNRSISAFAASDFIRSVELKKCTISLIAYFKVFPENERNDLNTRLLSALLQRPYKEENDS